MLDSSLSSSRTRRRSDSSLVTAERSAWAARTDLMKRVMMDEVEEMPERRYSIGLEAECPDRCSIMKYRRAGKSSGGDSVSRCALLLCRMLSDRVGWKSTNKNRPDGMKSGNLLPHVVQKRRRRRNGFGSVPVKK